ncbi:unnamed protein product [Cylindrotheca closterium]|uniref:PH domain-containing protein n=1 Tax=Cylindrotheca closterium TaxID=2856 RepID=A0AAD2GCI8_9STRA|nr:unnamed protein product [Cylindrotheca closterium]
MEAISIDELDDDTGMLQIVDEDDVGLNDILPRTQASDGISESMDNIDTERDEDDSSNFEILDDEDEEDLAAGLEEEGFLEKVTEENEVDVEEDNSKDGNTRRDEKNDEGDTAKAENSKVATTGGSPPTQRKFFKVPVSVMSPVRTHKKNIQSPGVSAGSGKIRFIPSSVEKVIRSKMASIKGHEDSVDLSETMQERSADFFSDDSSSDDSSLDDSSLLLEDDADEIIDVSKMGVLPNTFLNPPPSYYDYMDQDLLKSVGQQNLSKFAWEHHLLSRGLMQLMAERDHIGVEANIDDTGNVLKMGPLKLLKKTMNQKSWTVKLVEIRKGNLIYFDDKAMTGGKKNVRTTVHLRKRTCRCEAVTKPKDGSSPSGFVFALIDEGGKRIWMAQSEEEMEGWMRTINQAMIGETDESMDIPLNMAQYKQSVEKFDSVRNFLANAETQSDYMAVAGNLLSRYGSTAALRVPMRWIREEVLEDHNYSGEGQEGGKNRDAPRHRVKSTVADFWKVLCDSSIAINGNLVEGNSPYSGERIIGALSRCLLEYDKVDRDMSHVGSLGFIKREDTENFLTEAQAVSHARSILTGALKSKSRDEALRTVEELMKNENVVECVELKLSEPMHIDVSFANDDFSGDYQQEKNDLSGWAQSRTKETKGWKERYFVLSEGVLSAYMDANPRPYGLRGQYVLKDFRVDMIDEENIIKIHCKDDHRQLLFDERADFVKWKHAIDPTFDGNEQTLDSSFITSPNEGTNPELKNPPATTAPDPTPDPNDDGEQKKKSRMGKLQKEAKDTGERAYKVMKGARDAGIDKIKKIIPRTRKRPNDRRRRRQPRRRPTVDMLRTSIRSSQVQMPAGKRVPTVQVVVELRRVYNVIAKDPNGEGQKLMKVKVKLFHAFLVSGGPNGRFARGDELIDMIFVDGDAGPSTDAAFLEVPTAL